MLVTAVNGQSTRDWGFDISKFVQAVRGPAGTTVSLTVERDGQKIDATLTREKILLNDATLYYSNRSLCYDAKGDAVRAMEDAHAAMAINQKKTTPYSPLHARSFNRGSSKWRFRRRRRLPPAPPGL